MKPTIVCVMALAASSAFAVAPWKSPEVTSVNRLPARAIAVPCESAGMAMQIAMGRKERTESKWLESLNGVWNFKWKHTVDCDWEKSGTIAVPGCWQLQGEYDPPLYTNITYPIAVDVSGDPMGEPPAHFTSAHFRNPVGLYSRTFTVPADWEGRRIAIHFGGVSSAMFVRLNGSDVGYSEDSRLPAEFDLTPYLKSGENALEVEVLKHCDGTYLEDQDFWRMSGIFRDVWLVAERPQDPKDLVVEATLSDDFQTGYLTVRDENGNELLRKTYDQPRLWSCEKPNLYYETIAFQKKDGEHPYGDYRAIAFGFRKVLIRDAVLYINGRRALFMGVDRHEMSPDRGYAVTVEEMKRDIAIFRDLNINAVRTSHYPNDPAWYELCDREGIYVVCEANLESHGLNEWTADGGYRNPLSEDPAWKTAHVERGANMVKTFRNHPSIVIWSLGNECGDGPNFIAEHAAMRALDPTRPIQFEPAQNTDHSDIKCPMYARPWEVEEYVKNNPAKPFILCEYSHAMGNSNGDIQDYWDIVRKYPSAQGGFIWDFADQALWKTDEKGTFLAYGGDFGDQPNDDNFNCNGLVAADRSYHPGAHEVKHAYQPVNVLSFDWESGEAEVENRWRFTTLDEVNGEWRADKDGVTVAEGTLSLVSFLPESTRKFKVEAGAADCVTFSFSRNGREIAHDQFVKPFAAKEAPVAAEESGAEIAGRFKFNFWRAPVDNDRGWGMPGVCEIWKTATETQTPPEGCETSIGVKKLQTGGYLVSLHVKIDGDSLPPVPRVGLSFTLPSGYDRVKWYGMGPWENYCDRRVSAMLGVYEAGIREDLNPENYIEPGEQGYRTLCRSLEISGEGAAKVRIEAISGPFGFNAWPYSQDALEAARHQRDLAFSDEVTVNIDAAMMGVGGDDSWGARPHGDDMLGKGEYTLVFTVEGI
ncbi:MAG: hypothetical protein ILO34_04075 [Kiritimatiellae bacterium]|nr:hypothetical protein [Kiritimatiellia bacterium]